MTRGMTARTDGVTHVNRPSDATLARMEQLGVDISAPAWWRLWVWWCALTRKRARLNLLAHRLGLHRGEVLAVWKIGGEFLSPTTHGVLAIRTGSRDEAQADLHARRPARPRAPRLDVATYEPGEQIADDGTRVPPGHIAIAATLTTGRSRYTHQVPGS